MKDEPEQEKRSKDLVEEQWSAHIPLLERLLENIPIGIVVQDAEGSNIIANAHAEKILGIDREEITSRRYDSEQWDRRDREGRARKREDYVAEKVRKSREPVFDEEVIIPRPGGEVVLLVNAAPLKGEDGSYHGLIYAFEDITQRIGLEKELMDHRERLQELVAAKTSALRDANRKLEKEIEERILREKELQQMAERLRALSHRIETVREEEKARFASRIHDTFEQSLAILKMQVKDLERSLSPEKRGSDELERIYNTFNSFLDEIQKVSQELRPRILDDAGLVAAMEWQMKDVEKRSGIETDFHSDVEGLVITEVLSTYIYRVFQEVVENSLKHSQALNIQADLSMAEGMLSLVIDDDGLGMSQGEMNGDDSISLQWMKERAKHFGGSIDIIGRQDKGTKVTLRIPLSNI